MVAKFKQAQIGGYFASFKQAKINSYLFFYIIEI